MVSAGEGTQALDPQHAAAVRAELSRILASDAFRTAPQLSAFLGFIVERAVVGRGAEVKGYTVAVEAFGRSPDFDPQADPIVRVEAGRLRKALSQYYLGDGIGAAVRIAMPVGGYVPAFEFDPPVNAPMVAAPEAGVIESAPGSEPARDAAVARRWLMLAASALLAGLAAVAFWYGLPGNKEAGRSVATAQGGASASSGQQMAQVPVLSIVMVDIPRDAVSTEIATRFSGFLIDALARFDDVVTVKTPGEAQAAGKGADYVLELSAARFGEMIEASARLKAVDGDRIVWTSSNRRPPALDANDPEWPQLARSVAIRLAEPFGVLHADFRHMPASSPMRCSFQALDFRRTQKAQDHLEARACLEAVLERDPTFQPAWSHLAFLILDEYTAGLNPQPGPPLDRALAAALNAVRLSPASARAQQAMMAVLFARGQTDDALAAGREAMTRNPFDPDIMAGLGARLVQLGRAGEGLALLQKAIALSNGRPPSYDFFAFLAARATGNNQLAAGYAANLVADEGALSWLGRALSAAATDDNIGLAAAIAGLETAAPLFRVDPRMFLEQRGFSPDVATRIISDLGPTLGELLRKP